ncbi:MAG: carboxypeptidase-like regulatory domain-containing protein, partial [Crocinitomicaceae bacterium]
MKLLLSFFLVTSCLSNILAQKYGTINGTVKDKNTQELLPGVVIKISGADSLVTVSDINGVFSIEAPVGNYSLQTAFIGYKPFESFNVNLNSGNAQVIVIELEQQSKE